MAGEGRDEVDGFTAEEGTAGGVEAEAEGSKVGVLREGVLVEEVGECAVLWRLRGGMV